MRLGSIAMAALLVCVSSAALAQREGPGGGAGDRVLKSFADCRAIAAPDARLACFDHAAGALENAVKAKDVTIVDRQDLRKARRSLFGFAIPKLALFAGRGDDNAKDEKDGEFVEINTTVAGARSIANGRVELTLAEADLGTWQTTDPVNFPPRSGAKIRIRRGLLNNYFLLFDGRSYRGGRVR
jgi:hypothetical protein